ncbi:type II secretion system F family protein [Bacillus sp. B15-48]|uniref:type II secretion system F family protein n=1 Tax=Bacillus sp. B15-48 TaxID=1548601 RepID=UPI0019400830|nr:type II secretion system F family protein [Bacillus sp. B15-48]
MSAQTMIFTIICIFLLSSLLSYLFLVKALKRKRIESRMKSFLPAGIEEEVEQQEVEQKQSPLKGLFFTASRLFQHLRFSKRTEKLLLEAGSSLKPEEFFVVRVVVFVLAGLVAFISGFAWYILGIASVIGYLLPTMLMKRKRDKRLKLLSTQLVESLGMMSNSMRAGFSFMQAMQIVAKEMPDPIGPEFDRVIRQAGLGVPLDEVFTEMVNRLPNKELEVVVRGILAQRKSGGNLAALMETMEETVRGRIRILEELNTLTAQGRMSSWVITLLPVGMGFYLALMNRDYFAPMLEHPLGLVMLSIAAISIMIGWFFIQKIIKIEV